MHLTTEWQSRILFGVEVLNMPLGRKEIDEQRA